MGFVLPTNNPPPQKKWPTQAKTINYHQGVRCDTLHENNVSLDLHKSTAKSENEKKGEKKENRNKRRAAH